VRAKPYSPRWRPDAPGTDNCRAYYLLHEGSGNPVGIDPNAITMKLFGASWGAGPFGPMLDFNAAESDLATIPSTVLTSAAVPNGLSMTALFTLPVMPASSGRLWEMGDQNFEVTVYSDGHLRVVVASTTYGTSLHNTAAGLVTTGTTYALTQVLRRSTGDNATKELYLNGSSVLSVAISFDQFLSGLSPTGIASRSYGAAFLDLDLHALVVQETALTPTQISALHTDLTTGTFAAARPRSQRVLDLGAAIAASGGGVAHLGSVDLTASASLGLGATADVTASLGLSATATLGIDSDLAAGSVQPAAWSGSVPRLTTDSLARGLAGWWPMALGVADVTSYGLEPGLDGTLVGGASRTTGPYGGALDFPIAGRVDCGTGLQTDRISVAAWVYPTNTGSTHTILAKRDNSALSWMVRVQLGTLRFLTSGVNVVDSGLTVPANQWSFVGITYTSGGATFYVNGKVSTTSGTQLSINSAKVSIGGFDDGTTTALAWSGKIGQVAAWDRILSLEEFRELQADYWALWHRDDLLPRYAALFGGGAAFDESLALAAAAAFDPAGTLAAAAAAAFAVAAGVGVAGDVESPGAFDEALALAGAAAVGFDASLSGSSSVALSATAGLALAGGVAIDRSLGLGVSAGLGLASGSDLAGALTLDAAAGLELVAGVSLEESVALASVAAIAMAGEGGSLLERRGPTRFASTVARVGPAPRSGTVRGD